MKKINTKIKIVLVFLLMVSFGLKPFMTEVFANDTQIAVSSEFETFLQTAEDKGEVSVIVGLKDENLELESNLSDSQAKLQQDTINQKQEDLIKDLSKENIKSSEKFQTIPYLTLTVTPDGLRELRNSKLVKSIEENRLLSTSLFNVVPHIGADVTFNSDFDGSGQTVAILDTGIEKAHELLDGKVVSEACFSTTYAPDSSTTLCPNGLAEDLSTGSGEDCTFTIGCSHGTYVGGIAAGKNTTGMSGIGKESSIISIQVFSRINDSTICANSGRSAPCVLSYTSDQIKALERVYNLRTTYSIAAVNLSLGSGSYSSNCDSLSSAYKTAIDNLRNSKIATIVASGNSGSSGISFPSCISTAISVGATFPDFFDTEIETISSFSNHANILSLLAPGEQVLTSSVVTGYIYEYVNGTSFAAPFVTGAWAVLKEFNPNATVSEILTALQNTGVPLTKNSITKPRIQLDQALMKLSGCNIPSSGNWTLNQDCTLIGETVFPNNVTVQNDSTLTIAKNAILDLDFVNKKIDIVSGSNIILKPESKLD